MLNIDYSSGETKSVINLTESEEQEFRSVFTRPEVEQYLSTGSEAAQSLWNKLKESAIIETMEHEPTS